MLKVSKKQTKFSVVLPTYNSEATVRLALQSIRDQQWADFEIIVVDGGSGDNTIGVIKSFSDLNMVIIGGPDEGIYDAINKGVSRATGDLICVLGSDDRLASGAFSAVNDVWLNETPDIIAGEAILVSLDGDSTKRRDEAYGLGVLVSGIPFCHNSMYVTPEAYRKVGSYNLNYRICADAEWVHRAVRSGCCCSRIEKPLVYFALSGTSSSNDELIMAETFAIIAANFPGLSVSDAAVLFKAVRRWTDDSEVADVLERHHLNTDLLQAVRAGLYPTTTTSKGAGKRNSLAERVVLKLRRIIN